MPDTTARYSLPFQEAGDAPDGPNLGEDLATAVDTALGGVEDKLDAGYSFMRRQVFTSSGSYAKATDVAAGARKLRVMVQGAGGGSGGCQTNPVGQNSAGGGGAGGGYAESWLDVSALGASVTVTVGAGGTAGGTGGTGSAGTGGTSSFGASVVAGGGGGGANGGTAATSFFIAGGSAAGQTLTGDVVTQGSAGAPGARPGAVYAAGQQTGGAGGGSRLGGGGAGGVNAAGEAGGLYGGGAGGSSAAASTSGRNGLVGAAGVVIVEVYR